MRVSVTPAYDSGSGWQSGISDEVRLAAMMPARRAVSRGSPFFMPPARICFSAAAEIAIRPRAAASRAVAGFAPTSTIRMRPAASRCVRPAFRLALSICVALNEEERETFERDRQIHVFQFHAGRDFECPWREIQDRLHA